MKYSAVRGMQWKFNPPAAPWWGGWWERMVRMVKDLLKRVLRKACLTYEEMNTTLCDCEAVINSRPITYLSDDITQPRPLTPAMFLRENTDSEVPDLDQIEKVDLKGRFRYRQEIRDNLRKRFRTEYLGQLSRRSKYKNNDRVWKMGEIVLIGSDNEKRLNWPLARVIGVINGRDGVVRVLKLRTANNSELVRPVQRVLPLEIPFPGEINFVKNVDSLKTVSKENVNVRRDTPIIQKDFSENSDTNDTIKCTRSGRQVKAPERLIYNSKK